MAGGACVKKFRNCEFKGKLGLWDQTEEAFFSDEFSEVRRDSDHMQLAAIELEVIEALDKANQKAADLVMVMAQREPGNS